MLSVDVMGKISDSHQVKKLLQITVPLDVYLKVKAYAFLSRSSRCVSSLFVELISYDNYKVFHELMEHHGIDRKRLDELCDILKKTDIR